MEKPVTSSKAPRRGYRDSSRSFLIACLIAFPPLYLCFRHDWYSSTYMLSAPYTDPHLNPADDAWINIEPSETLEYRDCRGYEGMKCARLKLPLDWNDTDNQHQSVAIALMKIPAKVPVTDPRYGGPIFINPGGPGGSGIAKIFKHGERIRATADYEDHSGEQLVSDNPNARYFDIVGFDPRGVNHSTPKLLCFPNSMARQAWTLQNTAEGIINSSDTAFEHKWSRWGSFVGSCMQRVAANNTSNIASFMNTTPVVADMLEILERHGEWQQKQADAWLSSSEGRFATAKLPASDPHSRKSILERTRWRRGEGKMSYWGVSYGSVIGATFAAMYPDRISRFVLDGVEDPQRHYSGLWTSSILHADKAIEKLFRFCFDAGSGYCPIYQTSGHKAMQAHFDDLLTSIKENPLAVSASSWRGPDVITYSNIKTALKDALYYPIEDFPLVAQLLADIDKGNGSALADVKAKVSRRTPQPWACEIEEPYSPPYPDEWLDETEAGIQCTDGESTAHETRQTVAEYIAQLASQSRYIGEVWAEYRLRCIGWSVRPKWRFSGPFQGNTSHPLLIIANTIDPVTPAENAFRLSRGYSGSVVLQQDCVGHGSLSAPSICTANAIRAYFQKGILPPPRSTCAVDKLPFYRDNISHISERR